MHHNGEAADDQPCNRRRFEGMSVNNSKVRPKGRRNGERGFSMLEMLVVVFIVLALAGMAIVQLNPARQQWQANAAMIQVASQLRQARELAISGRRNIQVQFVGNNSIRLTRLNIAAAPTILSTVPIQSPFIFMLTPGVPDTPDAFGNLGGIEFGGLVNGPPTMMFQSDGTFVDTVGNILNGTVFLGIPNVPVAGRAVTVVGATGRIRMYKGTGRGWVL
jgi:prepilin-type N-terminal cleavage/methylation domain-containing protein